MRQTANILLISAFVASAALFAADDGKDDVAQTEFFERKIRPLLAKRCYECHSTETAAQSGHLVLDGKAGLLAGGSRGPVLNFEFPDNSLLLVAIRYSDPKLQMPPDGKLSQDEVDLFIKWIQSGGFVPDYGEAVLKKNKVIDWKSARQFWSFQPIKAIQTPMIDHVSSHQIDQPMDVFIQQKLAEHQLQASEIADSSTLIRRLAFDLLGLPPNMVELGDFATDQRPDSYERLVDRLLASPHFGERWGRYWLDLVRYTDVTPTWLKNADQAWMYRDWIIRAINEDLPYDEFVKKQIAADLFENSPPEDNAALGLIGLSPTYWKELQLAPGVIEVIVADEWDERIDAVTRTFLGLTVACARCHDHKFDPITSRDYYALAGVFASTQLTDRPLLPSPLAEQISEARFQAGQLEDAIKVAKDKDSEAVKKMMADLETLRTSTPQFDARMAHVVEDASIYVLPDGPDRTKLDIRKKQSRDLPIYQRGNPANPGEIVPRRFIEVLSSSTLRPLNTGSGRGEFAAALFDESAGLTARVIINRIWTNHFGRGIVRTPSDFGAQGDPPSHPELLEWLAGFLTSTDDRDGDRAWKLKRLHRQIVTSYTYRQASRPSLNSAAASHSVQEDPDNQWLSRMNRRRLDVEPWRDSMLAASGTLNTCLGGPAEELDLATNVRRTLYGKVGRDEQNDMLRLFDFPPPTSHSPARDSTTTPLQQLFVLNSEFVESQSNSLSARIQAELPSAPVSDQVIRCYQIVFQREPTEQELTLGKDFLGADSNRWPLYIQSLFGLNELLYVD